jgi:cytochrome o ubiquinol oxidase operon protein cyoD
MTTTTPDDQHGLRFYLTGFAFALILTLIPFGLVATGTLSKTVTLVVIAIAAICQFLVHLRYFLNLNLTTAPRERVFAIAFTVILIFIMVGGTLWIMLDLHNRMMT